MKKIILLILVFFVIAFVAIKFVAIPRAEENIVQYFEEAGFKNIQTQNVNLSLKGINIERIDLDKDGFNNAKNIHADIAWHKYLFGGALNTIQINTLSLSSVVDAPKDILFLKKYLDTKYLKNIGTESIEVKNLVWDIALPQKALRFTGGFKIEQKEDTKLISGNLNPAQHELSFNSEWSGQIDKDGSYLIESVFNEFSMNTKVANVKRGTGFLNFSSEKDGIKITTQFDAGSGSLLNIPIKNINLILNQNEKGYPVTLRAQAANFDNAKLFGDFNFSNKAEDQAFDLAINISDPNKFINHLKQQNIIKSEAFSGPYADTPIRIKTQFKVEDRFANGPLPFMLQGSTNNNDSALNGTFLIYPNKLDVRGTVQGDTQSINFIQTLFSISDEQKTDNNIRFKENLKSLF